MRTPMTACLWLSLAAATAAQAPAQAAPATVPPAQAAPANVPPAVPTDPYSYLPDGRRDPFVSLVTAGSDDITKRGTGLVTFMVNEISVRGVMKTRERMVAMVQGPDDKTYVIHQGDKLADGVVKSVTTEGLVVIQNVTDPLSAQKQREVRKLLRSLEEAKE